MSSPPSSPLMGPVTISEDLAPLPSFKAKGVANIDFDGVLSRPLKVHEDVRSGCGGQTWPAGMLLGKHMLRYHKDRLSDARILELGAGGGLIGLAVALECTLRNPLLVTDQMEMYELMKHNIELNNLQDKARAMVLNWGEDLPAAVLEQEPDVILAGECVYFEPAFPLLMSTLKALLELNPTAVVYFCFKKRRRADMNFVKMAKKSFKVEEIFDEDRPVFQRQGLFLFSFTSRLSQPKATKSQGEHQLTK
ncbi:Protein-lysine N-methyltransferase efm6 [Fusarium torreyae]|uniref:Protein-lysine N-methyltransferase EFM6 n=1 Tax=Fusarium torreyae TaxID=1237075 RepID=A0A9W8S8J8_9HYPO|nr:Protein-lysine N-methyltransferase efm6 [Fusarium torreyae]